MKFDQKKLASDIWEKRMSDRTNQISLRSAAQMSGVSFTTLSRIERGQIMDINTFLRICKWLNNKPSKYFI